MKRLREKMEDVLLLFFLAGMAIVMIFQVISRYVLKDTPAFTEELVRYLFIWSTFLSIPFSTPEILYIRYNISNNFPAIPESDYRFYQPF